MDLKKLLAVGVVFAGGTASVAALFAKAIGLDSDVAWGPSRYFLLLIGVLLTSLGSFLLVAPRMKEWGSNLAAAMGRSTAFGHVESFLASIDRLGRHVVDLWYRSAFAKFWRQLRDWFMKIPLVSFVLASTPRSTLLLAAGALILGIGYYYWLVTLGRWRALPDLTHHFDLLARGLANGQFHLPLSPSPELLAVDNPYALEARQFMPPVWDVSYFKEKFYLYWGPLPAVIALITRELLQISISDSMLTFLFVCGSAAMGVATVLQLHKRLQLALPARLILPPIVVIIFAVPLPWLLSRPAVYEAAIITAQFFLLFGLWLILPQLLAEKVSLWRTMLASLSFGFVVAARVNLLPAAGFLVLAALGLQLLRDSVSERKWRWQRYAATLLPFIVVGILLLLYNWVRFESLTEFGHRFQLGRWNKFDNYAPVLNLGNLIPNLYNYLFNPPHFLQVFPFLKPAWGEYYIWPAHFYAPEAYHTEKITGILLAIPYLWFAWRPVKLLVTQLREYLPTNAIKSWTENAPLIASLVLLGSTVLALAPLLFFVSASMRHQTDVVPLAILLATIGIWTAYAEYRGHHLRRRRLMATVWLLTTISVTEGVLLAFTGFDARFERGNPDLYQLLTRWLTP